MSEDKKVAVKGGELFGDDRQYDYPAPSRFDDFDAAGNKLPRPVDGLVRHIAHAFDMFHPGEGLPDPPSRFFQWDEVRCRHSGDLPPQADLERMPFWYLMEAVETVRVMLARPLIVSSWYRCPQHPLEAERTAQDRVGAHQTGLAVDILVHGRDTLVAARSIFAVFDQYDMLGHMGMGWSQRGPKASRFIHVDLAGAHPDFTVARPASWSY